jgi:ABC-2 type transport system permease protein
MSEQELYDSSRRPPAPLEELTAVWRYRDLIAQLVARDVKMRYKRSVLGVAWTMLNPLLTMLVMTFVFSHLFRFEIDNFPVYLLSAVICWNFFAQSTTSAMYQLVSGGSLLRRIYLPRATFALSAVGTGLVNLALAVVPLIAIMLITGTKFGPGTLWLFAAVIPLVAFALGIALLISSLSVSFPDVIEMYQVVLTMWSFLTPTFYPVSIIPPEYQWLIALNPMYYLMEFFRSATYRSTLASSEVISAAVAIAAITLLVGWMTFTARADRIAYRV